MIELCGEKKIEYFGNGNEIEETRRCSNIANSENFNLSSYKRKQELEGGQSQIWIDEKNNHLCWISKGHYVQEDPLFGWKLCMERLSNSIHFPKIYEIGKFKNGSLKDNSYVDMEYIRGIKLSQISTKLDPLYLHAQCEQIINDLESVKISHCEIKEDHIIVKDNLDWVLIDFGWSRELKNEKNKKDRRDLNDMLYRLLEPKYNYLYIPDKDEPIKINKLLDPNYQPWLTKRMYEDIFIKKEYFHDKCVIDEDDIVVDIGANIGMFSRFAKFCKAKKVYSFEPHKENFKCLIRNKPPNCKAFNYAIAGKDKLSNLYIDQNIGGHSLIYNNTNNTKTNQIVKVECRSINSLFEENYFEKIDFLKIDVEGAEYEILREITDENLQKINKISLEYHHFILGFKDFDKKIIQKFSKWFNYYKLDFKGGHLSMLYFWKK